VLRGATIRNVPTAITIDPGLRRDVDQGLAVREHQRTGDTISDEHSGRDEISMENVVFAAMSGVVKFRESARKRRRSQRCIAWMPFRMGLATVDGLHGAIGRASRRRR